MSTPETLSILATEGLDDTHMPPDVAFAYAAVVPAHTTDGPIMGLAAVLTDTVNVTEQPLIE